MNVFTAALQAILRRVTIFVCAVILIVKLALDPHSPNALHAKLIFTIKQSKQDAISTVMQDTTRGVISYVQHVLETA